MQKNKHNCYIFRLHNSTTDTYSRCGLMIVTDPSSVVCLSVGLSVTQVSPAKTAQLIEMPFGLRNWMGPGNHVFDGSPDPPMGRDNFERKRGVPL